MEAGAPLTFGAIMLVAAGFFGSTGFLFWLFTQFKSLKEDIAAMVAKSETDGIARIGTVSAEVSDLREQVASLGDKIHAAELKAAQEQARIAETYMTKASATKILDKIADAIETMRTTFEARLASIEGHLRRSSTD